MCGQHRWIPTQYPQVSTSGTAGKRHTETWFGQGQLFRKDMYKSTSKNFYL